MPDRILDVIIGDKSYPVELWQCRDLPALFLQGKNNMLEAVHQDKKKKATTQVAILDENGDTLLQEIATISGRGNGTWVNAGVFQDKRPYNLRFSNPISFGPFEDLDTLCLFAEYSDESKLRNSLAYFAGQTLGIDYASPYKYINVYVNGEYLGLYGITTKKEYTKDINQIQSVFECTGNPESASFYSGFFGQGMKVMHGTPEFTETIVNQFESTLHEGNWEACEALADLDSFAIMYALEEFLCNIDMSFASQYYYIDQEDILHTMLPWDFDYSMGSAITYFDSNQVRSIMAYRDLMGYSWYPVLLQWDGFRQRVADTIETYFTDEFLEKLSSHLLQDMKAIERSRICDMHRWEGAKPFTASPISSGMEMLPEFYDFFTSFFLKRRDFLLEYFRNFDDYCCITLRPTNGVWYHNVCIPKGSRPADYIDEEAFFRRAYPDDPDGKILVTEAGIPLSQLESVREDLTLIEAEPQLWSIDSTKIRETPFSY